MRTFATSPWQPAQQPPQVASSSPRTYESAPGMQMDLPAPGYNGASTFGFNPQGQSGQNSGNLETVQTGITPGPVYNPQQMQGALGIFGQHSPMPAAPGVGATPGQSSALNQLHSDSMNTLNAGNRSQFDREAAMTNAQQLLSGQRAQSDSGLQWGNLGTRLAENNFANANNMKTNILKLSQALGLWG